ncbi:cytochrome c peroxidase [Gilvimarinus sp. SDUM040013]|uniref:Cytochrome c peroxidase n=1 Tax=Gilvimarinus gilvus TaxID=3058038 RepID=A0ABU4S1I2_9GAMM|nr:cytochrome c peroxidase [Gilvimarinus sp. SDUM040013]MDO3384403.1 cytochrome c peroxidase [Gilvimarinus sp. SDUM040013]MDX6851008.1 cytochrome c peroxidase [Gilvimarinus sp. SDUM040013]
MIRFLSFSHRLTKLALAGLIAAFCTACGSDSDNTSQQDTLDDAVQAEITDRQLTGDPSTGRNLPSIDTPKAQLGKHLFFSKALSGDMDTGCVTCHHPTLGGGDDLSLSVGVDADLPDVLGPGRLHSGAGDHFDGGPTVPRNAPTTFNIGMWDKVLFHDGRVESLGKTASMGGADGMGIRTPDVPFASADPDAGAGLVVAQARFPVTSPEEMKNFGFFNGATNQEVRQFLQERLGDYGTPPGGPLAVNSWLELFQDAYGPSGNSEEVVTFNNMADAIAAYENSQVFVDTPWKAYVEGDTTALTQAQKRGALLFFRSVDEGGADCAACHTGDFFTDEDFHNVAMIQVGRGKGNGATGTEDFGRFRETGLEKDRFAFRTPTLLNVGVTGPWGHAGAFTSMEAFIRQHTDPERGLAEYDWHQIDANVQVDHAQANSQAALDHWLDLLANGESLLPIVELTDREVNDLVAFMDALTDPCVESRECLAPWIPADDELDPDGMRVIAVDMYGEYL